MKKIFPAIITLCLILGSSALMLAQDKTGDILLDAMNDELTRNMKELHLKDFEKPFFMMYGINDKKVHVIGATLGSLTNSVESRERFKNTTRVIVGSYEFNDESLDESSNGNYQRIEIPLPLDDDYLGIRRSFWSTTDNVYRNAARHFHKHKQTVKESGKELADLPHRSFAQGTPARLIIDAEPYTFNKKEWEGKVRRLSAVFLKYPSIENSVVLFNYSEGYRYLVNSEGTLAKLPESHAMLLVFTRTKNENGEFAMNKIDHYALTPDQLPSEQQLVTEIEKLAATINADFEGSTLEDEYSGPVLLLGHAVGEFMSASLFKPGEGIMANDYIARLTGYQYNSQGSSMDNKLGKQLIHESLTIKAKPKLKEYNGTPLFGSYQMDNEGIVPADEVVVFEKGVLKELLNDRTITHKTQKANGFSSGAGVLEVTSSSAFSEKQLKDKLLEAARKQGLDYALIIRDENGFGSLSSYKISVADGKEEKLRNTTFQRDGLKVLKRVLGTTTQNQALNIAKNGFNNIGGGQGTLSMIVPQGLLIEEVEVKTYPVNSLKEEQYTSRPW